MNTKLVCALSLLISLNIAHSRAFKEDQHEINDGMCSVALVGDMVFHDHVHKWAFPLLVRDGESSWRGDKIIYCLKVLNDSDDKDAIVFVRDGGVGHNFVNIEMHSQKSDGMEFTVQVFAK